MGQNVSPVLFLGWVIRCAVAMASVKEAELARETANALATRNMGVTSVINAAEIITRASEMNQNCCVHHVTRHVRVTVLVLGPRAAPSASLGST